MATITIYDAINRATEQEKRAVVSFLFQHLGKYGDPEEQIMKAVEYALKDMTSFGGFVVAMHMDDSLVGAVVVNQTGMGGYIPENILVYIATHAAHRGEGLGRKLLQKTIDHASGDIALHVEANNPARKLYERLGFTNPYLEMRLKK